MTSTDENNVPVPINPYEQFVTQFMEKMMTSMEEMIDKKISAVVPAVQQ